MKFVTEALQHLLSDSKIEENALLLLEFILELLSRVCGQAHDLTFDQDARIFDIWSFLLFFNFKLAIFSQKNFQKLIEKFLLVTTSFHPCTMLPRKRSLVLAFLSDPVMTEKFLNFLKDSCKFLLDDAKCYIVTTYEAEELILLTLIYTTQSLKFLYGLDNDLSSYLYTYYIMSTPHINFDILFKVCQKVLLIFRKPVVIYYLIFRH